MLKIVDIALSQNGMGERQLNEIVYNEWYYGRTVYGGSYPYCAVFVAWCADQAGLSTNIIPKTASVASLHRFFLDKNQFHPNGNGYIPVPGDIMIQRSRSASHTGIVVDSDAESFTVVEGNAGEGVVTSQYSYTDPNLTGFGHPNYPEEIVAKKTVAKKMTTAPTLTATNSSPYTGNLSYVVGQEYIDTSYGPGSDPQKNRISIHHTGGSGDSDHSAAAINEYQTPDFGGCIAYHFVIRKDGTIERGRREDILGYHTWQNNTGSLGIQLSGNFDLVEPTQAQLNALTQLIGDLCVKYNIPVDRDHIRGHREYPPNDSNDCPGTNLLNKLDTVVAAVQAGGGAVNTNTIAPQLSPQMTEEEIWDWFRYKGYSATATAGIMGRMRCETNGYDPSYDPIVDGGGYETGGMGMFQWTWDVGDKIDTIPPTADLNEGRQKYPDSRLASYLNWCDQNGKMVESCASQLEYYWDVDLHSQPHVLWTGYTFQPSEVNDMTPEEAARHFRANYFRGAPSNEESEARTLYEMYKDRPVPTQAPSSTGQVQGNLANANMRAPGVSIPTNIGRYTYISYVVKQGDTLESIAKEFNIAPQMIMFANSLKEWNVTAGETIYVPQAGGILPHNDAISGVGELEQFIHTRSVTVSHPTAVVHFFGEYGKLAAKSTLNPDKNENVYNDIISITTNRNMAQDCPNFVITLVWRNEWYDKLASNDMLIIWMQRPPEANRVVMYGLIDDIRRTIDWSSNQPKRAVQVSGRGFNKALCHFDIGLLENYSGINEFTGGFFNQLSHIQAQSSCGAIEITLNAYIDKGLKYKFGNGKTLKDYFVYRGTHKPGEILMDFQSFTSFNGSMWNFIKELGNAPFNETFWEVIDDKPSLIHRPTPFNKNEWVALNRLTIKDENLVSNNTGRSDLETYTVFNCHFSLMGEETINIFPPAWYPPFYPKYGLRELKVDTVYEMHGSGYETREFTRDLFNFNIKNNIFENGTLVVKGSNQYRVGERVILESEGTEFYVEAVSHNFNVYNNWITSLNVTRGITPAQRFTPPFGAAEDLTPTIMVAIIEMTGDKTIDWYSLTERQFSASNGGNAGNETTPRQSGSYSGSNSGLYDFKDKTFTWPIQGHSYDRNDITSPFGPRNTGIPGASTFHKGIDIAYSGDGGEPIVAACDGTVTYAGAASGYGNYIEIDHGDGIMTGYAHMYDQDLLVQVGQKVSAGTHIANVGANGIGSGPHLHFEVLINGERVDPETAFQQRTNTPHSDVGVDATMEEVAQSCYQYLKGTMGLNDCAACAVLGNIQQESSFNIIDENSIGAFGLCQWFADRRDALERWCRQNGHEVTSVAGQMGYFNYELHNSESESLSILTGANNARESVYTTSVAFGESFERYNKAAGEEGSRGQYAVNWWDKFVKS